MTTIKVYGKIRSNSFSGNYTPCARWAKQVFTYCTCLRLHGCHQDYYIMLKRNCTQIRWCLLKCKRTRSRLKGNKRNWRAEAHLRLTLNEILSVFWSSRKLFSAFLLRLVALVVHLQVFLIKHFASILSVLRSWVNYGILWYLCGFREGTVDYFLYKLINLAKFAIFLMELSLPAGKFLNWAALAALVSHIRSNAGIMADNRDLVNQSES